MKKIVTLIFVFKILCVFSQSLPSEVEVSVKQRIEFGLTPSIAIGIVDKNGARYYEFGTKTLNGTAVDRHTIYEIGSITKTFTAILLAQQVVEGKMKLDDPIKKYLPSTVKVPQYEGHEITLGNLADHTSGLPRMPSNFAPANPNNPFADYTVQQMYDFISSYSLPRDVGAQYEYSNLAQGLLGHILARHAGTSYEDLMIRTIASPLEMKETKITMDGNMEGNLAAGHSSGMQVENWEIPTLAGAGAIRSSTYDMLRFLAANAGLTKTSMRNAMDLTHTVRHDMASNNRVGLGWHIANGKDGDVVWHNGGTGGYRAFAGFVKETGIGVVVLTNSNEGADDLGFHLLNPDATLAQIKPRTTIDARIEVSENILEKYVGEYELAPTFFLIITRNGKQLFAQATGQSNVEIFPKSETEFFYTVVNAQITFDVEKEILTLHQNGRDVPGKRVKH